MSLQLLQTPLPTQVCSMQAMLTVLLLHHQYHHHCKITMRTPVQAAPQRAKCWSRAVSKILLDTRGSATPQMHLFAPTAQEPSNRTCRKLPVASGLQCHCGELQHPCGCTGLADNGGHHYANQRPMS